VVACSDRHTYKTDSEQRDYKVKAVEFLPVQGVRISKETGVPETDVDPMVYLFGL